MATEAGTSDEENDADRELERLAAVVLDRLLPACLRYRVEVARRLDLDGSALACLDVLRRGGPVPASVIGERIGLTSGAVSKLLDRLEEAGHVDRAPWARRGETLEVSLRAQPERDAELGRLRAELVRGLGYAVGHRTRDAEWDLALGLLEDVADRLHVEARQGLDAREEQRRRTRRTREERARLRAAAG